MSWTCVRDNSPYPWFIKNEEGEVQRSGWKSFFVVLLTMLVGLGTESQTMMATPSTIARVSSLAVTTASSATISIDADAYVKQSKPARNYGLDDTVNVSGTDDPRRGLCEIHHLHCERADYARGAAAYVDDNGTQNGPQLYGTSSTWGETAITWNNAR